MWWSDLVTYLFPDYQVKTRLDHMPRFSMLCIEKRPKKTSKKLEKNLEMTFSKRIYLSSKKRHKWKFKPVRYCEKLWGKVKEVGEKVKKESTFNHYQTNSWSLLTDWLPGSVPDSDWLRSLMLLFIHTQKAIWCFRDIILCFESKAFMAQWIKCLNDTQTLLVRILLEGSLFVIFMINLGLRMKDLV